MRGALSYTPVPVAEQANRVKQATKTILQGVNFAAGRK